MNAMAKIETRLAKNENLASIVTEDNIFSVIPLALTGGYYDQKTIITHLDRKTCKASIDIRVHSLLRYCGYEFGNYVVEKNEAGENVVRDTSILVNHVLLLMYKKLGFESFVNVLHNAYGVSVANVYKYMIDNGLEDELNWHINNFYIEPVRATDNSECPKLCSGDMRININIGGIAATVLRMHKSKYLSE